MQAEFLSFALRKCLKERERTVHDHRQKSLITVNAEHVDDTLLAKAFQCTFISRIGNGLTDVELRLSPHK